MVVPHCHGGNKTAKLRDCQQNPRANAQPPVQQRCQRRSSTLLSRPALAWMGQDRKSNYSGPQPPLAPPATSLRTRLLPALRGPLMRPGDKSTLAVLCCAVVLCCACAGQIYRATGGVECTRRRRQSHSTTRTFFSFLDSYTHAHCTIAGKRLGLAKAVSIPSFVTSSSLSSRATAFFFRRCTGC